MENTLALSLASESRYIRNVKKTISSERALFSITSFLHNYFHDFFQQLRNWELSTSDKPFPRETLGFDPCLGILIVRKKPIMCYHFWFKSTFELIFLGKYKFDFVHRNFNWNIFLETGGLGWKVIYFHSFNRILIVLIFQNDLWKLIKFHFHN